MNAKRSMQFVSLIAAIALILLSSFTTGASAKSTTYAAVARSSSPVFSADETPKGYSLAGAAAATAYFNTGPRTSDTLPGDFPFQILYTDSGGSATFTVSNSTMFYVPVLYSSDIDAAFWPFPDVTDPAAVSAYYFDPQQLGADYIKIVVDGTAYNLGPEYAAGAVTPGLPDGGNNYTVVAAFLKPLSKGTHTVTIAASFSGSFIVTAFGGPFAFEIPYTVIVH